MNAQTRTAPCKVNLALDILRRRPDGYHDMKMVMQTLSLGDCVTVESRESGFALHAGDFVPAGKETLEERAIRAFFQEIGREVPGLSVTLDKIVPAYAGLGGGSADVAALLRCLRQEFAPELPTETLERIGFTVGSDMPFCVRGGTALAEGRGEILTDLPPLPHCWFVLCKPEFGIPTGELFAKVRPDAFVCRPDIEGMQAALAAGDLDGVAARLCNVFEELVPENCREVFTIRDRLRELGALNAAMSGSGPTVFAIFRKKDDANRAAEQLRQQWPQTFVAAPVPKLDTLE